MVSFQLWGHMSVVVFLQDEQDTSFRKKDKNGCEWFGVPTGQDSD